MTAIFWIIAAYLLGSISFAIVLSEIFKMDDPRSYGSNNPGATNMLRSGRKNVALLTLIGDTTKGYLPVVLAHHFTNLPFTLLCAVALAAFLGHLYPVFFGFKGGKGVATFFGAILGLSAPIGGGIMLVWLAVAALTRYSSLASLTASLAALALLLNEFGAGAWLLYVATMVGLLFWRHRANITNLLNQSESKLFAKNKSSFKHPFN